MAKHLLSLIIFTPLIGAATILSVPKLDRLIYRYVALITSLVTFVLTCVMLGRFDQSIAGMQFVENYPWIESLSISYNIGIDGLSVFLIVLTALVFLLGVLASWELNVGTKGFYSLFLLLETLILGTLSAQDLFLFFAFWEASILPIYFMLGVWGHENRVYAATKFFLFQLAGGALLFLGMLVLYYAADPHTFNLAELAKFNFNDRTFSVFGHDIPFGRTIFLMMFLGLAVRLPVFPLHSWFPVAQTEAPTVLSVVLAALFIKTGAYGIMRVNYQLFPAASKWFSFALAVLGVINIIYGAFCALGQKDVRRLMAYMCMSHMGFVMLGMGIFSTTAFHGALLEMFSHGIYAGLLFFLVGILGSRAGHFNITDESGKNGFGGLVSRVPVLTGFFTVGVFAAIGVPGLAAFPAESLVFLGTFPVHRVLTIIGLLGLLLTAGYFLWMYRKMFLGVEGNSVATVTDLTVMEKLFLVPLVLLCVFAGFYPSPFINFSAATIGEMLNVLQGIAQ